MSWQYFLEWDQFDITEYVGGWEFLRCDPVVSRNVAFVSVPVPHKCGPGVLLVRSVWHQRVCEQSSVPVVGARPLPQVPHRPLVTSTTLPTGHKYCPHRPYSDHTLPLHFVRISQKYQQIRKAPISTAHTAPTMSSNCDNAILLLTPITAQCTLTSQEVSLQHKKACNQHCDSMLQWRHCDSIVESWRHCDSMVKRTLSDHHQRPFNGHFLTHNTHTPAFSDYNLLCILFCTQSSLTTTDMFDSLFSSEAYKQLLFGSCLSQRISVTFQLLLLFFLT